MSDEEGSEHVEDNPNQERAKSPLRVNNPNSQNAQQVSSPADRGQVADLEDRLRRAEIWIITLTGAIAFFALCAVVVGILQWSAMRGQLREMRKGALDTHTLAEAAKKQADKADTISTSIQQAVAAMKAANSQAKDSFDKTFAQNKATLDATIGASKLDQRAWVGIGQFHITQFEKDKPFKLDVEIRNSGKTPALHVYEGYKYALELSTVPGPQDEWFKDVALNPAEAVPPQGSHITHMEIPKELVAPFYDSLKSQERLIYIFGRLNYTDISNRPASTDFCVFMTDPNKPDLAFCGSHNDMK